MYWLRWHYGMKDIAGASYKIKPNRTLQKRRQSVNAGRQQLHCAVYMYSHERSPNHRRTTTEKVVFRSRWNVVSDGVFLTDDGRLFHACAEPLGMHGRRAFNVHSGGRCHQHGCVRGAQTTSSVDVRCPVKARYVDRTSVLFSEDSGRPEHTAGM